MQANERLKIMTDFMDTYCWPTMTTKGQEYAKGSGGGEDINANFSLVAKLLGQKVTTPPVVYLLKAIASICRYEETGNEGTEPIEGRIGDAINYLLIYASLVDEAKRPTESPKAQQVEEGERQLRLLETPVEHSAHYYNKPRVNEKSGPKVCEYKGCDCGGEKHPWVL